MSFRPTLVDQARQQLKYITSKPGPKLPKYLKQRVLQFQAQERHHAKRVEKAKELGLPRPDFRPVADPGPLKWYRVRRSEGGNLPVYTDYRADGGCSTMIRKIEGDHVSLMRELNAYLWNMHVDPITNPPRAILRPTSGIVVVKGMLVKTLRKWLLKKGF